ncbi:hypothetical protein Rhal01_01744 [Rubritalea halochordaticola]|uniref:Sulfatase N-terminal domain-containing protein n=1 Tax=Rubritalea halochordaticola TaxID=714537 RepID=A0ABP9V0S7_9BACT
MDIRIISLGSIGLALSGLIHAAQFDFGNGTVDGNTGVAANVVITDGAALNTINATVDGISLTMQGMDSGGGTYGSNSQGFGIYSSGTSGATDRRISDGDGETVQFSFDKTVTIQTVRMGSMTNGESFSISFVSGIDPFGGGNFTFTEDGTYGPTEDIPVNIVVEAGTVLEFTTVNDLGGGVLWNDMVVAEGVVTPSSDAETLASFPTSTVLENPVAGASPGVTTIASGNAKGQSFSLAAQTEVTSFVFEITEVTTSGAVQIEVARGLDNLPWLDSTLVHQFTLPADLLSAGDYLQVNLPSPLVLSRGTWTVTLEGVGSTSFSARLSGEDLYPEGSLMRKNGASGNIWDNGTTAGSDLVFAVLGTQQVAATPPAGKPNLVFVLVDDLGWTDIQAGSSGPNVINGNNYGSTYYQTPNVARLAAGGLSFTHCYVQQNCAPTRAAILSGLYPSREGNGVYNVSSLNRGSNGEAYNTPSQNEDVAASHVTIGEALQSAGYVTAHFGKYHAGEHEGGQSTSPENQGYEYNFGGGSQGNPGSFYASGQKFAGNVGIELDRWADDYTQAYLDSVLKSPLVNPLNARATDINDPDLILSDFANSNHDANKHLTDAMGDAALSFLDDHRQGEMKDFPFYMQFHFYAVHTPIQPRWDLRKKYNALTGNSYHDGAAYAALVEGMDQTLGRILDYLEDPNGDGDSGDSIANNTLIIFTSDNGGHSGATDNYPLRHVKGSIYEGGIRVPLIVWQPGTVPAGEQSDSLVHAVDFYPTLVEHAGSTLPAEINFDGTSFDAHMADPTTNTRDRETIFYHLPGYMDNRFRPCSVALGRVNGKTYKLIYTYDTNYAPTPGNPESLQVLSSPWELYCLDDDISETNNLMDGSYSNHLLYGGVADTLAAQLRAWIDQGGDDWNIKQITDPNNGNVEVPFLPSDAPDVIVPHEQQFHITGQGVDEGTGNITMTWNSEANFVYQIEASSTMQEGSWQVIEANIVAAGSSTTKNITDPAASVDDIRFYRVKLVAHQ